MPRIKRTILKDYRLVEITNRTIQSLLLLRPSAEINRMMLGALGRAQKKYKVDIYGFVFLSNHYHLLIGVESAKQMADFIGYFQSKIAKEVLRRYGWKDTLWPQRFRHIPVNASDQDSIARLRYLFANSCKEGLVESPLQWPGLHCAQALSSGKWKLEGDWMNRTKECKDRARGKARQAKDYLEQEWVYLSPLPCWENLTPKAYRRAATALIRDVERETKARHRAARTRPLGSRRVLRQNPLKQPERTARSPKPRVHALKAAARNAYYDAYNTFLLAYEAAAEKLRDGRQDAVFPKGCFPPALPFVQN